MYVSKIDRNSTTGKDLKEPGLLSELLLLASGTWALKWRILNSSRFLKKHCAINSASSLTWEFHSWLLLFQYWTDESDLSSSPCPFKCTLMSERKLSSEKWLVSHLRRWTWTGDFKCREVKTGFYRNRSMQTGSSETLIGWKSGQTTFVPLWDWMEGAWLRTLCWDT